MTLQSAYEVADQGFDKFAELHGRRVGSYLTAQQLELVP